MRLADCRAQTASAKSAASTLQYNQMAIIYGSTAQTGGTITKAGCAGKDLHGQIMLRFYGTAT
jgi:hypothetical protein